MMYNFYIEDLEPAEKQHRPECYWGLHDKKDTSWGNKKHEPISNSIFPPFRGVGH